MEILILNTSYETICVLDNSKSLIWNDRYDKFGDFELCLSMDSSLLHFIKEDYYLWCNESDHCMIIEDIGTQSDAEDGNYLNVTGRSLESILERRIVWGTKIFSGNLQTNLKTLIEESIISPSITDRKIDNFIFEMSEDEKITKLEIEAQFTGDNLYDIVNKLCVANKLGFKLTLNNDNRLVFKLYYGVDRSYSQELNSYVIFSPEFENIISSNYYISKKDYKNVTYVAGEGEGSSRKTAIVGSGLGLNRREIFTDARDVSSEVDGKTLTNEEYTTQLQSKGRENLSKHIIFKGFDGEVEATRLYKYGEDFFIGDIVQFADAYKNEGRAYISELIISQSADGISIYPTFQTIEEEGENIT